MTIQEADDLVTYCRGMKYFRASDLGLQKKMIVALVDTGADYRRALDAMQAFAEGHKEWPGWHKFGHFVRELTRPSPQADKAAMANPSFAAEPECCLCGGTGNKPAVTKEGVAGGFTLCSCVTEKVLA